MCWLASAGLCRATSTQVLLVIVAEALFIKCHQDFSSIHQYVALQYSTIFKSNAASGSFIKDTSLYYPASNSSTSHKSQDTRIYDCSDQLAKVDFMGGIGTAGGGKKKEKRKRKGRGFLIPGVLTGYHLNHSDSTSLSVKLLIPKRESGILQCFSLNPAS